MDFINDMQQKTAYDTVFTYPDNLTAPLTFSLCETEVGFYKAMQKLYKKRNAKGEKGVAEWQRWWTLSRSQLGFVGDGRGQCHSIC